MPSLLPIKCPSYAAVETLPPFDSCKLLDERYSLRRVLAKTEAAIVYAAVDVRSERAVAVKVLRRPPNRRTAARMRREVEALARVRGDGIVEVLDTGEADGKPYIVLEMLEGRTLAGLLTARARLTLGETVDVGIQLAAALERCHAHGVVHRDVKPGNVFVVQGRLDRLKLLDFGIALLADPVVAQRLTADGALLGTPEYMAPEALLSQSATDRRVDVYSLGVVLYECLTGAVPHEGAYGRVLLQVFTAPTRPLHDIRGDVPQALSEIVHRCLGRFPEDRFQSMGELRSALALCQSQLVLHSVDVEKPQASELELQGDKGAGRFDAATVADTPTSKLRQSGASRRRHVRAAYTTPARVRARGSSVDGRVEDVSEGGLQFFGPRAFLPDEKVAIRFALPASGRITQVSALARWCRFGRAGHSTGFEFLETADAARAELRTYLAIMSPEAA